MKLTAFAFAAVVFLPAALTAQAQTATREGTKIRMDFTVTVKTAGRFVDGRNATTTSTVNRVLKGQCQITAGPVGPYGLDGPTKEQEKEMKRADSGMASLEKEAAKCKGNQACLMALAQKASQAIPEPAAAAAGGIQVWYPQSCSASITADDVYTADIKDGGSMSYAATSTIKGTGSFAEGGEKGWLGMYIEHDLTGNQVVYRFNQPPAAMMDKRTVRTGYQAGTTTTKVPVQLTQGVFPNQWGPVKGPLQAGSLVKTVDGGTLTMEWQVKR